MSTFSLTPRLYVIKLVCSMCSEQLVPVVYVPEDVFWRDFITDAVTCTIKMVFFYQSVKRHSKHGPQSMQIRFTRGLIEF